jgi:hypothetical protein
VVGRKNLNEKPRTALVMKKCLAASGRNSKENGEACFQSATPSARARCTHRASCDIEMTAPPLR